MRITFSAIAGVQWLTTRPVEARVHVSGRLTDYIAYDQSEFNSTFSLDFTIISFLAFPLLDRGPLGKRAWKRCKLSVLIFVQIIIHKRNYKKFTVHNVNTKVSQNWLFFQTVGISLL